MPRKHPHKKEEKIVEGEWERWPYEGLPGTHGRRYGYGHRLAKVYAEHFRREGFNPPDAIEFLTRERDKFDFLSTGNFNRLVLTSGGVHSLYDRGILERKPDPNRFGSIYRFTEEAWNHLFPKPAAPPDAP